MNKLAASTRPKWWVSPHQESGFSLFELVFTLAIIGVAAAIATPNLKATALNSERSGAINDILSAALLSRNEAVKRGVSVRLCGSSDGVRCLSAGADWAEGILAVADVNNDGTYDPSGDDVAITYSGPISDKLQIFSNNAGLTFRAFNLRTIGGTISICDPRGADESSAIIVSASGRPHVSSDGANDANCPS